MTGINLNDYDYLRSGLALAIIEGFTYEELWVILDHAETGDEFLCSMEAEDWLRTVVKIHYGILD
jgi:hypothetical protein